MRSIIIIFSGFICLMFSSCVRNAYKTQSSGQDNAAYVTVLRDGSGTYGNRDVVVVVDNVEHPYGKVRHVRHKIKSRPVVIEPGKHNVKVVVRGQTVEDETVFLGVQESKVFVLR